MHLRAEWAKSSHVGRQYRNSSKNFSNKPLLCDFLRMTNIKDGWLPEKERCIFFFIFAKYIIDSSAILGWCSVGFLIPPPQCIKVKRGSYSQSLISFEHTVKYTEFLNRRNIEYSKNELYIILKNPEACSFTEICVLFLACPIVQCLVQNCKHLIDSIKGINNLSVQITPLLKIF